MPKFLCGLFTGAALSGVAFLAFAAYPAQAQRADVPTTAGAAELGAVDETIAWRTFEGITRKATIQRAVIRVPAAYGILNHISDGGTFWYVDAKGVLRNVLVGNRLVTVEQER